MANRISFIHFFFVISRISSFFIVLDQIVNYKVHNLKDYLKLYMVFFSTDFIQQRLDANKIPWQHKWNQMTDQLWSLGCELTAAGECEWNNFKKTGKDIYVKWFD